MSNRDLTIKRRQSTSESSFFALPNLLYGASFGAIGGIVNAYLTLSFFGSFTLYFGQILVLLCLVSRGINATIVAVTISSLVSAATSGDPYLIILFALEIIAVHTLLKRGFFLLQSSLLYWVLIGLPLFFLLSSLSNEMTSQVLFFSALTLIINGLVCVSIASIFYWTLPQHFFKAEYNIGAPKLASLIFSLCMLTVTLPATLISLFFINQASHEQEKAISQDLLNSAKQINMVVESTIAHHEVALQTVANYIANRANLAEAKEIIAGLNTERTHFSAVSVVDARDEMIVFQALQTINASTSHLRPSLKEHLAFIQAREDLQARIAYLSLSADSNQDNTLVFFVPIIKHAQYAGMMIGSILKAQLSKSIFSHFSVPPEFLVFDSEGKMISGSINIDWQSADLVFDQAQHPLIKSLPLLTLNQQSFLYHQSRTKHDWTILSLTPPRAAIAEMMENIMILIVCAMVLIVSFAAIAKRLSQQITKPIEDIAEHFPDKEMHLETFEGQKVSEEIIKLRERLIASHALINEFQDKLKEQVESKTKQLKQLNRELYSLAQKDGLTQLLNRAGFNRFALTSYRNCVRNNIKMSLVLIDIDHFKAINDTYGHPFGDKCISTTARLIQQHFKRDTDIIGRFGGEEFIIMIIGGEIIDHHFKMQVLKESISKTTLLHHGKKVSMTISAGIVSIVEDFSIDFDSMIKLADEQLYYSKRTGRDKISILKR